MGYQTLNIIERHLLKRLYSSAAYEQGLKYFESGVVTSLAYDANHDVWTAKVLGSEPYFVEVKVEDPARVKLQQYCDCPAYEMYGECKHIVAVLLAVEAEANKKSVVAPKPEDFEETNRLIQSLSHVTAEQPVYESILERSPMHVEYIMKWAHDGNLFLELKTGIQRKYVVRNVAEFLGHVHEELEYEFTKNFIYHPENHYFLEKDLHIFKQLRQIIRSEEVYDRPSFQYYHHAIQEGRSVVLPPLVIRSLLPELTDRDLVILEDEKEYKHVKIVEGELPFQFSVATSDVAELTFTIENVEDAHYFAAYELLFAEGMFYFIEPNQVSIIEEMMELIHGTRVIPVAKEQADLFLSAALPSLRRIGEVKVADHVTEKIVDVPLEAKLYLEMRDTTIYGSLEYCYGVEKVYPFGEQVEHEKLILRDIEKEQRIMNLIERADFHFNGAELYLIPDEAELYDFLYTILPRLERDVEVYLTSELRYYLLDAELEPTTNIRVDETANLLDIGFDITGVNDDEVASILSAVVERKRYYRLQSGEFLSLESEGFQDVERLFTQLKITEPTGDHISVPLYRGAEIDELIEKKKFYDLSFRKLLNHLESPEEQDFDLPEGLEADLRTYQEVGYRWFKSLSAYHLGGILADDMGLGKTLQSIAYIASEPSKHKHLVVTPSSVVYNWKREFEKFAPNLTVAVLAGAKEDRQEIIESTEHVDVWVTSYATLRQDIDLYAADTFQSLILDEAQYIKNYRTKTSQAIRRIKSSRTFALSGTPIENSIEELWAIFQVILPGLMPSEREFKNLSHEQISRMTRPFILRRLKSDVLTELPEKIESVHMSELTTEQKELYLGYWQRLRDETASSIKDGKFRENRMKILAGITRLRQICCHPSLFVENYQGTSGKLEQLLEMLDELLASGKRILLFSQFTSMHEILIPLLEARQMEHFYLHGGTKPEERVDLCERFNQGEKSIFLISLKAGGTGLNLTGADTVILYDLWWNPAVEDQAAGRAHRFGQKNVVQVMRLITEGTIEEKIYELQQKKRELIDAVIKPGEEVLGGLSEDDVRELLSI